VSTRRKDKQAIIQTPAAKTESERSRKWYETTAREHYEQRGDRQCPCLTCEAARKDGFLRP
jgi:hypothetical protein